jgi:hypothetical protein
LLAITSGRLWCKKVRRRRATWLSCALKSETRQYHQEICKKLKSPTVSSSTGDQIRNQQMTPVGHWKRQKHF